MTYFTAIVEKNAGAGLFVAHLRCINGTNSQGEMLEEQSQNLKEVLEMQAEE